MKLFKTLWQRTKKMGLHNFSTQGSITMEYVIVSSFALLLSISAVAWISKIVKQRIDSISSKLGTDPGDFDVSLDTSP